MNINPINIGTMNNTTSKNNLSFGAFVIKNTEYLQKNFCANDIKKLMEAAKNIKNTEYYDLYLTDTGFSILNKLTGKFISNIRLKGFGPRNERLFLVKKTNYDEIYSLNELTNDQRKEIDKRYSGLKSELLNYGYSDLKSEGVEYVYYTDLLEQNEIKLTEKRSKEEERCKKEAEEREAEEAAKSTAMEELMRQYGNT